MLKGRIERAKELLAEIHHIPIATVNEDGSPHESPVFMAFDDSLQAYWASHPEAQHSRNIARDGRVFMVVFDSRAGHGGLYIEAKASSLEDQNAAAEGHEVLQKLKQRFYGEMAGIDAYLGNGTQRIYCATPLKAWVNKSDRDARGVIIGDRRYEIPLPSLLS